MPENIVLRNGPCDGEVYIVTRLFMCFSVPYRDPETYSCNDSILFHNHKIATYWRTMKVLDSGFVIYEYGL